MFKDDVDKVDIILLVLFKLVLLVQFDVGNKELS